MRAAGDGVTHTLRAAGPVRRAQSRGRSAACWSKPCQTNAPPTPAGSPRWPRTARVDTVVAAILFVFGAVVVVEARRLGAGWTSDGPGAGYFPFYIGLIICISALGVIWQARAAQDPRRGAFRRPRADWAACCRCCCRPRSTCSAIWLLGIYVASALYIALFMIVLGKYPAVKSVVLAVIVNAVFFMMFEVWFKVPLYKGMLEPLRFLGY